MASDSLNLLVRISKKIGDILELNEQQQEIIKYGLSVLFNNLAGMIGVMILAYLIGAFVPTLAIMITLLLLRPAAGGAHCSNPLSCNIFGFVFIPLLGYGVTLLDNHSNVVNYIYLICIAILALYGIRANAPYFTQEKPRAEARRKILKRYSLGMALILFGVAVTALLNNMVVWGLGIATGLLFQGIMLLPLGIKGTRFLDNLFNRLVLRIGGESK